MAIGLIIGADVNAQTLKWYNETSSIAANSDYYLLNSNNQFLGQDETAVSDANNAKKYSKGKTPLDGYSVISAEQYNALCPQQFLRRTLGDNNIKCTAWYNNTENTTKVTYSSYFNGLWYAGIETGGNGIRHSLRISGLKANTQYTLGLSLSASVQSTNSSYKDGDLHNKTNNRLDINGTEICKINTYQDINNDGSCKGADSYNVSVKSDGNGEILIQLVGNSAHQFARLTSIENNTNSITIGTQSSSNGNISYTANLSAGAYSLTADAVAQDNPGFLYATVGGQEQKTVFQDANTTAVNRNLIFVLPSDASVTFGYRYTPVDGKTNSASNFKLQRIGDAPNTIISCQVVNSNFNMDNDGIVSDYGWQSLGNIEVGGTRKVFNYLDRQGNNHGVGQIYNGAEDVSQTITGLPNGWYTIEVQGFYRDAATNNLYKGRRRSYIYGNNCTTQMCHITSEAAGSTTSYTDGGYPRSLKEARNAFNEGKYNNNSFIARVTDHTLKIGFLRPESVVMGEDGADWTVINKVTLTYFDNATELYEGADVGQYIKNPSFESASNDGWVTSSGFTGEDNADKSVMSNVTDNGRYVGKTATLGSNGYYYVQQTVSSNNGGLPAGPYAVTAKITAAENSVVTLTVNGKSANYTIPSSTEVKDITLANISVSECTPFNISFSSQNAFCIDDVRMVKSSTKTSNCDAETETTSTEKFYFYNVEAGAFLGYQDANMLMGWHSKADVSAIDGHHDLPWSISTVSNGVMFIQETTTFENRSIHLYIKHDNSDYNEETGKGNYGIALWVDGIAEQEGEKSNVFTLTQDNNTGFYTIGIIPSDSQYGTSAGHTQSHIGWSGETNWGIVIPTIPVADKEPRGTHWLLMTEGEHSQLASTITAAHAARMEAWPVLRSARRSNISTTDFDAIYNNPSSTSGEITSALASLKALMTEKMKNATAENPVDVSYLIPDLDCQEYPTLPANNWLDKGGVKSNYDKYMFHTNDAIFGGVFYEMWSTTPIGEGYHCKYTKALPTGRYSLAVDMLAYNGTGAASGVSVFIHPNDKNDAKVESACNTSSISTVVTPVTEIHNGEGVYLGMSTASTTDAREVKFDNFKLLYNGPLCKVTTKDEQKTIAVSGTWNDSRSAELETAITNEGTGVTVDFESATITDAIDLTLSNTKNILVYTPESASVTINGSTDNVIKGGKCTKFVFYDGQSLNITKEFYANNVVYDRTMKSNYATVVLPVTLETGDNFTLYTLDGIVDDAFSITKTDKVDPNVPVILKRKASTDGIHINLSDNETGIKILTTPAFPTVTSTDGKLKLVGSYVIDHVVGEKIDDREVEEGGHTYAEDYYYISSDQFIQGWDYFYCDAFRAYIDAKEVPLNARINWFLNLQENDETTGIDNVLESTDIEACYSVNGTLINRPQKGINIIRYSDGSVKKSIR